MHLFQVKGLSPLSAATPAAADADGQPMAELQDISNQVPACNPWAQQQQAGAGGVPPASPACSPMSMELTGDTMDQRRQALAAAAGLDESDSLPLPPFQHQQHMLNITDNIPGLSTLIEEDEEGDAAAVSGAGDDQATMEMDLTGTTGGLQQDVGDPSVLDPEAATPAAAPAPSPQPRRSSRRKSMESPLPVLSPAAAAVAAAGLASPPSSRRGAGPRSKTTTPQQGGGGARTSMSPLIALSPISPLGDVSPSPLRRMTRSLSRELSPLPELPPARGAVAAAASMPPPELPGAGGGRRRGRESMALAHHQQSKWGFVPGDDDTMMMELDCHGRSGLGENTLHHVYSESTGTGDITLAARKGALPGPNISSCPTPGDAPPSPGGAATPAAAAAVGEVAQEGQGPMSAAAAGPGTGRRSRRASSAAAVSPAAAGLRTPAAAGGGQMGGEDMMLLSPAGEVGAGLEAEGMTTHLLLDEQHVAAWPPATTRSSFGGGRGSVGSNLMTQQPNRGMETPHLLGSTTQLLVEQQQEQGPLPGAGAAAEAPAAARPRNAAGAGGRNLQQQQQQPAMGLEDCTTKLLADTTGASCSAPGVFGGFRLPQVMATAAAEVGSPELLLGGGGGAAVAPAGPPAATPEPRGVQGGGGAPAARAASAEPAWAAAAAAAAEEGREQEVTLELHVTAGVAGALEENTLEEFGLPPELGGSRGSGEGPATMAFSGMLSGLSGAGGVPGSVLRTPGGSRRQPERITFQDFLQIVDLQFLDHIRRGTSINMMDLAPGPVPQDLAEALQLLSVTGAELAVVEGAIGELQAAMHAKRLEVAEREEALEDSNPPLFSHVQLVRRSELEGVKAALAARKCGCRAGTAASWKVLRQGMERDLAARLAQEQSALQEQLGFFQAKAAAAAEQQAALSALKADLQWQVEQEAAAAKAAEEARAQLQRLRQDLGGAQARNAERGRRLAALQQQKEELQGEAQQLEQRKAELLARQAELQAAAGAGGSGASQAPAAQQLVQLNQQLAVLQGLQAWQLTCHSATSWELQFGPLVSLQLSLAGPSASLSLLLAVAPRTGRSNLQDDLMRDMVRTLPQQQVVPCVLLPAAVLLLEGAVGRARAVAQQAQAAFLEQDLLVKVEVAPRAAAAAAAVAAGGGARAAGGARDVGVQQGEEEAVLRLSFVEPDALVKVVVEVPVAQLLVTEPRTGLSVEVRVPVSPRAGLLEAVLEGVAPHTAAGAAATPDLLQELTGAVSQSLRAFLQG